MRLPDAGERAYAYAKACGIIGRSFVSKRIPRLAAINRLSELDRLVFPGSGRELPERELLPDMERRFTERAVNSISAIIGCFSHPPEFLVRLIRTYEYADLKSVLGALSGYPESGRAAPPFTDLGVFQTVNFKAWPTLAEMIKGTEFEQLLESEGLSLKADSRSSVDSGDISLQTALDRFYYKKLWKALMALPRSDRRSSETILAEEISLRNAAWTLRLRTYYNMQADEVKNHLVSIEQKNTRRGQESAPLDFPLDSRAECKGWRWESLLNPIESGEWTADPRYFQNAASRRLYGMALHKLRLRPFSLDAVFCFIKLKQFEEDLLTSTAEGAGLGMSGRDVFAVLEVQS
jgi:vacuolar-type H+-ATPase subunit C/Vma6